MKNGTSSLPTLMYKNHKAWAQETLDKTSGRASITCAKWKTIPSAKIYHDNDDMETHHIEI